MCFISDQVLPTDESVEHKKSHRQSHRKKVLPEIYLTRLLSTKVGAGTATPRQGLVVVVCSQQPALGKVTREGRWVSCVSGGCSARRRWLPGPLPASQLTLGAAALL